MKNKSRLVLLGPSFLLGLSLLLLSGCGYDGHFRYPCQDPSNWEKTECKPPVCTASGTCPADLGVKQEGTPNG